MKNTHNMVTGFVITKSEIGGAQTWTKHVASITSGRKILITSEEGWLTKQSCFDEIIIIPKLSSFVAPSVIFKLHKIIKKYNINLMVASSANAGVYSRVTSSIIRIPTIYVSHGWSCLYNQNILTPIFIFIEYLLAKTMGVTLCISNNDALLAQQKINIHPKKIKVIQNKVPRPYIEKPINDPYQPSKLRFLFLARLESPKRLDLLIEASNLIKQNNYEIHVIGKGSKLKKWKDASNSKFTFHGEIEDFKDFKSYDVFCLFSDSEGLPMSALEAAAYGLPLLLSNIGGCPELIKRNGLICENTPQDIAKKLTELTTNIEIYKDAAQKQKKEFHIESSKEQFLELYREVLNKN